jgi:hypothetical protein
MTSRKSSRSSTGKYKVAKKVAKKTDDRQSAFDFREPLPPISGRGNYTTTPNEIYNFHRAYPDRGRANAFLHWLTRQTYGGQYEMSIWGPKAKALRDKGRRPKWFTFTMAEVAEEIVTTEDGAQKIIDFLENEVQVLVSNRDAGRIWYAIDYKRIEELKPTDPRKCGPRPKAETTNIPNDAPDAQEATQSAEKEPVIEYEAKARSYDSKDVIGSESAVNCGFSTETTLILKPGDQSKTLPLGIMIQGLNLRNAHHSLISTAIELTADGFLNLIYGEAPAARPSELEPWRKMLDRLTLKHWKGLADEADKAKIANLCIALEVPPEGYFEWADQKLSHKGGRIPRDYPIRTLVKITFDDFEDYWMAEKAEKAMAAGGRPLTPFEQYDLEKEVRRRGKNW